MTTLVVSVAIVNPASKRLLLAQRAPTTTYPWHWCTPGGKVDPGESAHAALVRELREELGVELTTGLGREVYRRDIVSTRTAKTMTVVCYRIECGYIDGSYVCGDKTVGVGWFSMVDLRSLALAPADRAESETLARLLLT